MKYDNIIIIGAAGRNVGKTEFACRLIKKEIKTQLVYGVKITTIKEKDGKCPRGGEGCGVCTSLKGNYMITEEVNGPSGKDTVRMVDAGAIKVYWLRVLQEFLEEGVGALMKKIPKNSCIVCESNSARQVIEPGAFIIIRKKGRTEMKHSCKTVAKFADKLIDFEDNNWSIQPEKIIFKDSKWIIESLKYDR